MDRENPGKTKKKHNDPQFMAFGRNVNKFAAMAAIFFLLLIVAVVFVIVLAYFLQS